MNDTIESMRELIIKSFDLLIWLLFALIAVGGTLYGFYVMFAQSFLGGIFTIIFAILYAIITAGGLFLLIGIHENSKRTAEALEQMANR